MMTPLTCATCGLTPLNPDEAMHCPTCGRDFCPGCFDVHTDESTVDPR